jgi:ATP-dependent DNA helicase RecG
MKIVNSCKAAGLPTPTLEEDMGGFMVKLFKDRFTEEQLQKLGLNERQIKAVLYVKEKGKITNSEYQTLNSTTAKTAFRDLEELLNNSVFRQKGENKGAYYELDNVRYVR